MRKNTEQNASLLDSEVLFYHSYMIQVCRRCTYRFFKIVEHLTKRCIQCTETRPIKRSPKNPVCGIKIQRYQSSFKLILALH